MSIPTGLMGLFREKFTILLVCKANITRSAYLQGYMKHYLREHLPHARRKLRILSAGVKARRGGSASQVVQHVARVNGFSLATHHSSPLTRRLIRNARVILVMEENQRQMILKRFPEARDRIFLLTQYLRAEDEDTDRDIPDPTGQDLAEYKAFIEAAHAEVERIFRELGREGII
jgi:protein-tyrosine phosphatase